PPRLGVRADLEGFSVRGRRGVVVRVEIRPLRSGALRLFVPRGRQRFVRVALRAVHRGDAVDFLRRAYSDGLTRGQPRSSHAGAPAALAAPSIRSVPVLVQGCRLSPRRTPCFGLPGDGNSILLLDFLSRLSLGVPAIIVALRETPASRALLAI